MSYNLIGGSVYYQSQGILQLIGSSIKTETIRLNDNIVLDITYEFETEQGIYIEKSRNPRADQLIQQPSVNDEIASIKAQNAEIIFTLVSNNLM